MVVGGRAASVLPLNLPHLQNVIKRDKDSYRSEFLLQQTHFYSTLGLMQASGWDAAEGGSEGITGSDEDTLENLITFMSHCVPCYIGKTSVGSDAEKFVTTLMDLLERDAASLPSSLRRCMCQALILMRSKKGVSLVPTERMLKLFFRLFGLKDKHLRELLYDAIVSDVRKANHPHRNNALNRTLQNFMYSIFSSSSKTATANSSSSSTGLNAVTSSSDEMTATKSLQVIIELYRRGIWNDAKTVNIIAEAALKGNCPKAMVMGLNFFLGKYPGAAEIGADDDDENASSENGAAGNPNAKSIASSDEYRSLLHACQVGGVSKAKTNRLKRILASDRKKARSSSESSGSANFSPLSLVNDPQGFAERLYRMLKGSTAAFEVKLLMMNVLSRFIAWHKLLVLDFYSFLLRYLQPHQRQVTQVLAYAAQATHSLIPPDTLYPVLRAIADNFVSEGAAEPVIAAGLNGVREICTRAPLAMTDTLLQDLTGYKKGGDHKNKGVMMAARSLITLFREINPDLLHRRDRGRDVSMSMAAGTKKKTLAYGEVECYDGLDNVDPNAKVADEADAGADLSDESGDELTIEDLEECDSDDLEECDSDDLEEFDEDNLASESESEECPELLDISANSAKPPAAKKVKFLPSERLLLPEDYDPVPVAKKKQARSKKENSEDESEESEESESESEDGEPSAFIDPSKIEGYRSRAKADYEARLASIHAGREGREKFGTRKKGNSRSSTTNKEKSKGKNFLMMAHKFEVKGKSRRSLKMRQAVQKKHKNTMKRRK